MTGIKMYECGLCHNEPFAGTRKGLRKHLREIHMIKHNLANSKEFKAGKNGRKWRQRWWKTRDFI